MSKVVAAITMSWDGSVTGPLADSTDQLGDVDELHAWVAEQDLWYGAQLAATPPFFVVTHSAPQHVRLARELGMRFTFVDDLPTAVDQARAAAADGRS